MFAATHSDGTRVRIGRDGMQRASRRSSAAGGEAEEKGVMEERGGEGLDTLDAEAFERVAGEMFQRAMKLSFEENYTESRDICERILISPIFSAAEFLPPRSRWLSESPRRSSKDSPGITGDSRGGPEGPGVSENEPIPLESKSSEPKPTESKPSESKPSESKPSEPKPSESTPSEFKPSESKPSQSKSSGSKPSESMPSEPNSSEPNPSEPKPSESKPSEPKPSEPKPSEPKPSEPNTLEPTLLKSTPSEPTPPEPTLSDFSLSESRQTMKPIDISEPKDTPESKNDMIIDLIKDPSTKIVEESGKNEEKDENITSTGGTDGRLPEGSLGVSGSSSEEFASPKPVRPKSLRNKRKPKSEETSSPIFGEEIPEAETKAIKPKDVYIPQTLKKLCYLLLSNLGHINAKLNNPHRSLRCYLSANSIYSYDYLLSFKIGKLAQKLGYRILARRILEEAVIAKPREISCSQALLNLNLSTSDFRSCYKLSKLISKLHPYSERSKKLAHILNPQKLLSISNLAEMLPKHDLSANPNLGPPDVENSSKTVEVRLEENSWKVLGNNLLNVFDTLYAHIKPDFLPPPPSKAAKINQKSIFSDFSAIYSCRLRVLPAFEKGGGGGTENEEDVAINKGGGSETEATGTGEGGGVIRDIEKFVRMMGFEGCFKSGIFPEVSGELSESNIGQESRDSQENRDSKVSEEKSDLVMFLQEEGANKKEGIHLIPLSEKFLEKIANSSEYSENVLNTSFWAPRLLDILWRFQGRSHTAECSLTQLIWQAETYLDAYLSNRKWTSLTSLSRVDEALCKAEIKFKSKRYIPPILLVRWLWATGHRANLAAVAGGKKSKREDNALSVKSIHAFQLVAKRMEIGFGGGKNKVVILNGVQSEKLKIISKKRAETAIAAVEVSLCCKQAKALIEKKNFATAITSIRCHVENEERFSEYLKFSPEKLLDIFGLLIEACKSQWETIEREELNPENNDIRMLHTIGQVQAIRVITRHMKKKSCEDKSEGISSGLKLAKDVINNFLSLLKGESIPLDLGSLRKYQAEIVRSLITCIHTSYNLLDNKRVDPMMSKVCGSILASSTHSVIMLWERIGDYRSDMAIFHAWIYRLGVEIAPKRIAKTEESQALRKDFVKSAFRAVEYIQNSAEFGHSLADEERKLKRGIIGSIRELYGISLHEELSSDSDDEGSVDYIPLKEDPNAKKWALQALRWLISDPEMVYIGVDEKVKFTILTSNIVASLGKLNESCGNDTTSADKFKNILDKAETDQVPLITLPSLVRSERAIEKSRGGEISDMCPRSLFWLRNAFLLPELIRTFSALKHKSLGVTSLAEKQNSAIFAAKSFELGVYTSLFLNPSCPLSWAHLAMAYHFRVLVNLVVITSPPESLLTAGASKKEMAHSLLQLGRFSGKLMKYLETAIHHASTSEFSNSYFVRQARNRIQLTKYRLASIKTSLKRAQTSRNHLNVTKTSGDSGAGGGDRMENLAKFMTEAPGNLLEITQKQPENYIHLNATISKALKKLLKLSNSNTSPKISETSPQNSSNLQKSVEKPSEDHLQTSTILQKSPQTRGIPTESRESISGESPSISRESPDVSNNPVCEHPLPGNSPRNLQISPEAMEISGDGCQPGLTGTQPGLAGDQPGLRGEGSSSGNISGEITRRRVLEGFREAWESARRSEDGGIGPCTFYLHSYRYQLALTGTQECLDIAELFPFEDTKDNAISISSIWISSLLNPPPLSEPKVDKKKAVVMAEGLATDGSEGRDSPMTKKARIGELHVIPPPTGPSIAKPSIIPPGEFAAEKIEKKIKKRQFLSPGALDGETGQSSPISDSQGDLSLPKKRKASPESSECSHSLKHSLDSRRFVQNIKSFVRNKRIKAGVGQEGDRIGVSTQGGATLEEREVLLTGREILREVNVVKKIWDEFKMATDTCQDKLPANQIEKVRDSLRLLHNRIETASKDPAARIFTEGENHRYLHGTVFNLSGDDSVTANETDHPNLQYARKVLVKMQKHIRTHLRLNTHYKNIKESLLDFGFTLYPAQQSLELLSLENACVTGDLKTVIEVSKKFPIDLNIIGLQIAAENGHLDIVKHLSALLENTSQTKKRIGRRKAKNLNASDLGLIRAAARGKENVVKFLQPTSTKRGIEKAVRMSKGGGFYDIAYNLGWNRRGEKVEVEIKLWEESLLPDYLTSYSDTKISKRDDSTQETRLRAKTIIENIIQAMEWCIEKCPSLPQPYVLLSHILSQGPPDAQSKGLELLEKWKTEKEFKKQFVGAGQDEQMVLYRKAFECGKDGREEPSLIFPEATLSEL
ncbi:hypothetical protein AAMO2058_001081400, partial [Amorphochlora amoebiformis]